MESFRDLAAEHPDLRLIVVPRHPERFEAVAAMLAAGGVAWQRRSRLEADGCEPAARVLLVDRVGELGAWWGAAAIAFVGGSLVPRGGQNMIEPAAYGAAVAFGPRTHNFRDVVAAFLAAEAAVVVADGTEMTAFIRRCLAEPTFAAALGQRARQVVLDNQGATPRTIDLLDGLIAVEVNAARRRAA